MSLTIAVDRDKPEDAPLVLAAEVVQAGGLVVYPTETLYGIGSNALDVRATTRIHQVKQRTDPKPILILVADIESVSGLARDILPEALLLMESFWPGPLTLVFSASDRVPSALTRGGTTVGIRVPSSALCQRLIRLAGVPLSSTSANRSGIPSPRSVAEIKESLGAAIDLYLDAGTIPESKPSTVVDVSVSPPCLLREGAVSVDALRAAVPSLAVGR